MHAIHGADGQQRNFKNQILPALRHHPATAGTAALLGVIPGALQLFARADQALALPEELITGLTTHGSRYAQTAWREGDFTVGKAVAGGGRSISSAARRRMPSDGSWSGVWLRRRALRGGPGVQADQHGGGDRFDFGNDIVRRSCSMTAFKRHRPAY